jgi:hypothetical protein
LVGDVYELMGTESDSDLLQSFIRDGNGRAFEELVGRHAPMVRGVALRCTGDPAEANEITQAVFTEGLPSFRLDAQCRFPGGAERSAEN